MWHRLVSGDWCCQASLVANTTATAATNCRLEPEEERESCSKNLRARDKNSDHLPSTGSGRLEINDPAGSRLWDFSVLKKFFP